MAVISSASSAANRRSASVARRSVSAARSTVSQMLRFEGAQAVGGVLERGLGSGRLRGDLGEVGVELLSAVGLFPEFGEPLTHVGEDGVGVHRARGECILAAPGCLELEFQRLDPLVQLAGALHRQAGVLVDDGHHAERLELGDPPGELGLSLHRGADLGLEDGRRVVAFGELEVEGRRSLLQLLFEIRGAGR